MEEDGALLTVGQAAARAGVSVRALHHWDHLGLVRPVGRSAAGYRLYGTADLDLIHRVVAYQRLGLGLPAIARLLQGPPAEIRASLAEQRRQLAERIAELQRLDAQLARMADAHERGVLLDADEQTAAFGPDWDPDQAERARQRWGDTVQWAQFAERSASRTSDQWRNVAQRMAGLERDLVAAFDEAVPPESSRAALLVDRHRESFSQYFPLTRSMQVCLGRLFERDPGYAAHYNGLRPGLASWLRRAIDHSARAHGINPEHATWQ